MPITARYSGTCLACKGPITPGQSITWPRKPGSKGYQHVDCQAPEKAFDFNEEEKAQQEEAPKVNGEATLNAEALNALAQVLGERIQAKGVDEATVRRIVKKTVAELVPIPVVVQLPDSVRQIDLAHAQFTKLLFFVGQGHHVYLWGPPGGGKSHGAKQVSEALGRPYGYISLNPQTPDSRLLGFIDAGGTYRRTVFRDIYENGGVFCIDELDNASPSLLTTLNSMLENGLAAFPDRMVDRHKTFVLVATGNTCGKGANPAFPERRPFDSAFADRFSYLEWGYDTKLEASIALSINPNAGPWIEWTKGLREWASSNMPRLLVTPRATFKLAQYTKGECPLKIEELVNAVVFRGLDEDAMDKALKAVPMRPFGIGDK